MKISAIRKFTFIMLTGVCLLLGWSSLYAQQPQNLLTNPGFENPYVTLDGQPPRQVAQGWTPWHVPRTADMPSFQNTQPEYLPTAPDTSRIRSGNNAQQYSSFFATHDGGVFQRVTGITPGTELRFSVYAYIWSTTFDDRSKSEEDGDILLQVGIDPTGGTVGTSSNIVWSPLVEQYDAYREYSVIAKASGNAVTVFVRSVVGVPIQNNYIYLDDAVLAPTTSSQPGTSATPTAEATQTLAPTATNTPLPTATNTLPPTATNTLAPTNTVVPSQTTVPPTNTTAPTNTVQPPTLPPTETPLNPTSTPEGALPTATDIVLPTNTSVPEATATVPTGGNTPPISAEFPYTLIHTVQRGDTVGSLAALYNSTTDVIIQANGLDTNALIYVGQGLIIPVRTAPGVMTATPTQQVVIVVTATPVPTIPAVGGPITNPTVATLYIVQRGDTLSRIATRFNTTVAAVAQLNGIVNPNRIQVGQSILIPATGGPVIVPTSPPVVIPPTATVVPPTPVPPVMRPLAYVVQPGDNLYRISLRFNVSMRRLMEINAIRNANLIYVGQVLIIP